MASENKKMAENKEAAEESVKLPSKLADEIIEILPIAVKKLVAARGVIATLSKLGKLEDEESQRQAERIDKELSKESYEVDKTGKISPTIVIFQGMLRAPQASQQEILYRTRGVLQYPSDQSGFIRDYVEFMITAYQLDVNADCFGYTLLHHAVMHQHFDVVELLINKGADIDARSREGLTALDYARYRPGLDKRIIDLLLKHGAVKPLINQRADIDVRSKEGATALGYASKKPGLDKRIVDLCGASFSSFINEVISSEESTPARTVAPPKVPAAGGENTKTTAESTDNNPSGSASTL